jgi:hypothetical protein
MNGRMLGNEVERVWQAAVIAQIEISSAFDWMDYGNA